MRTILDFLTSETAGFLLKLFSGIATAAFGMLGIGTKTRQANGQLTRNGWIALIGIVVAGLFAIGTSIYDFTSSQKKAKEEREKSDHLLLSVQRGIYPLKGIFGNLRIEFTKDFTGLAEYKALLRSVLPKGKGLCTSGKDLLCLDGDDNGVLYGVPEGSLFFPKRGSPLDMALRNIVIGIDLIQPKQGPGNKNFNKIGTFSFRLSEVNLKSAVIEFEPATGKMQYEIRRFRIPDDLVTNSGVYSLIEVFSGFMVANSDFAYPLLCHALKAKPGKECAAATKTMDGAIQLDELVLRFDYPKAIAFERGDDRLISCDGMYPAALTLMLPADIEQVDEHGNFRILTHPEVAKASICSALKDPGF